MIRLTTQDGRSVYVMRQHVVMVAEVPTEAPTLVTTTGGAVYVQESVANVLAMLGIGVG